MGQSIYLSSLAYIQTSRLTVTDIEGQAVSTTAAAVAAAAAAAAAVGT